MLNSLVVLVTEQTLYAVLVFKIDVPQNVISLHDLIEDIEVQGQLIYALYLLHKLSADWAADSEIMVQNREALRAKSVPTVDENSWNLFPYIELLPAIVAEIKPPCFVVSL